MGALSAPGCDSHFFVSYIYISQFEKMVQPCRLCSPTPFIGPTYVIEFGRLGWACIILDLLLAAFLAQV